MFRNPRENVALSTTEMLHPSVGRPPTPPTDGSKSSPYFSAPIPEIPAPVRPSLPVLGVQRTPKISSVKKSGFKGNQSITSFFGKAEKKAADPNAIDGDNGLFFEDQTVAPSVSPYIPKTEDQHLKFEALQSQEPDTRYNEVETPVKRRKISDVDGMYVRTPSPEPSQDLPCGPEDADSAAPPAQYNSTSLATKQRGGFVDDSDEEGDDADNETKTNPPDPSDDHNDRLASAGSDTLVGSNGWEESSNMLNNHLLESTTSSKVPLKPPDLSEFSEEKPDQQPPLVGVPSLSREATSMFTPGDFDENEDFEHEEFYDEGEEYLERMYMEEQRQMEAAFDEDSKSESGASFMTPGRDPETPGDEVDIAEASCPICSGSLKSLSDSQASSHVNACLDGTAEPLPKPVAGAAEHEKPAADDVPMGSDRWQPKRFQRAAIARPGQSNPFSLANGKTNTGSAFTKLMSGHAEDAAWAEAATNEAQSRGKPAYQRTCPFYKIMPGLYICVDAFRYGKVEGQNAYFLSHFHSDHYIGLTSSWCHGPIYASKVTCNLMRQQLRVDEKWLVPLEFEKKIEVPNTKGVCVTMLPANHCPGSSLYLFEKITGKNKDGSPKLNRILHCGDFRACPAHVQHPLLRPDVVDSISGQTKQQSIDTCYLDTTYLTPKYSFPSQHDVIDACAQMCVSLSKECVDSSDEWEKVKAERAGKVMTKFLKEGENSVTIKKEEEEADSEDLKPQRRGKLLVVIGTYSIGKERICLGIAKALNSKIYAPPGKMRICKCLEDPELSSRLTSNPLDAQVHMQTLMEIRAETLHDYLVTYRGQFSRVVGFRPTGWSYRPPTSRFTENPAVATVLHSEGWKSRFTMRDLAPQRGSTRESNCFGVPYSEHSSFRELTMFCCALRIGRVVPTVNVGSARSREKMKGWIEKWQAYQRKEGLFRVEVGSEGWGSGDGKLRYGV